MQFESRESSDPSEFNLKISKPTEKILEKQKRNKRMSKIFQKRNHNKSDEESNICTDDNLENISKGKTWEDEGKNLFDEHISRKVNFNEEDYKYSPKNHNYTLELFQSLSVEDEKEELSVTLSTGKENIYSLINNVSDILKELSTDREEKTSTSSHNSSMSQHPFPYDLSKNKMVFSERFKSSCCKDPYPSKRFKI
jgi:hypothetical protein